MKAREYMKLDFVAFPDYGAPKDAWLAARRNGIGSSDAAAIVGLDRFNTPFSVWMDKTGQGEEIEDNAMLKWGRRLEDAVATEFEEEQDIAAFRAPAMYQHADVDIALASPDRFLIDPLIVRPGDFATGLLEVKTGRNTDIWEDGPPQSYIVQVAHQLEVCGLDEAWIAVLLNGRDYRSFKIDRDPLLGEMILEQELEFWKLVESMTPPAVDGHEATTESLKRLYKSVTPDRKIEVPELADAIARHKETKARLDVIQSQHDLAANEIRAALRDAEIGLIDGEVVVTWKKSKGGKGRVDMEALEAQHPDIVATFRKPTSQRPLLVK